MRLRQSSQKLTITQNNKQVTLDESKICTFNPNTQQFENPTGFDKAIGSLFDNIFMTRKSYPTDLTDAQWQAIEPHFNQLRHYKWDKRKLVNAVLYITKTGCQWRMLPNDFPPYSTVWSFYRRANQSGLWDRILLALVQKNV